jgi:hypothetical protein
MSITFLESFDDSLPLFRHGSIAHLAPPVAPGHIVSIYQPEPRALDRYLDKADTFLHSDLVTQDYPLTEHFKFSLYQHIIITNVLEVYTAVHMYILEHIAVALNTIHKFASTRSASFLDEIHHTQHTHQHRHTYSPKIPKLPLLQQTPQLSFLLDLFFHLPFHHHSNLLNPIIDRKD